jgi:hypothetical protein
MARWFLRKFVGTSSGPRSFWARLSAQLGHLFLGQPGVFGHFLVGQVAFNEPFRVLNPRNKINRFLDFATLKMGQNW